MDNQKLSDFIKETEDSYLLKAPARLKSEILTAAMQMSKEQTSPKPPKSPRKVLLFYSLRVSAAAAAAIAFIFSVPPGSTSTPKLLRPVNHSEIFQPIENISSKLFFREDNKQ